MNCCASATTTAALRPQAAPFGATWTWLDVSVTLVLTACCLPGSARQRLSEVDAGNSAPTHADPDDRVARLPEMHERRPPTPEAAEVLLPLWPVLPPQGERRRRAGAGALLAAPGVLHRRRPRREGHGSRPVHRRVPSCAREHAGRMSVQDIRHKRPRRSTVRARESRPKVSAVGECSRGCPADRCRRLRQHAAQQHHEGKCAALTAIHVS